MLNGPLFCGTKRQTPGLALSDILGTGLGHPAAWSAVLAGAGVRGGIAHGSTDAERTKVADGPITVPILIDAIATLVDIDPTTEVMRPVGRTIVVSDSGTPVRAIIDHRSMCSMSVCSDS